MRAGLLMVGEHLRSESGPLEIATMQWVDGTHQVFNLEVAGNHTYLVGVDAVLSHNVDGCGVVPWTSKTVGRVAKQLDQALKGSPINSLYVKSRAEAEELVLGVLHGKGYRNTSGESGFSAKQFFGKESTYHWDDVVETGGQLAGHAADNPHAAMGAHLQVHSATGDIVRIFF